MGEAERRILQMLEEGSITAEEAENLIVAIGVDESEEVGHDDVLDIPELPKKSYSDPAPDMKRFRNFWRIPFIVAFGSLILSFVGLALMYQSNNEVALIGFFCVWSIFIIALLATTFVLLTRNAPWLHLRVKEKDGRKIAISLPLPMRLAHWGINIAKNFVPAEQRGNLDMAAMFMGEMSADPNQEPIVVNVDDEDGDKVQLFIG